jgi:hypothetical protein
LFSSGIDWEFWKNDGDERVAEAAESLIEIMQSTDHPKQQPVSHLKHSVINLPEPTVPSASTYDDHLPTNSSSFFTAPPSFRALSLARSSKLPSKQVFLNAVK